METQHTPPDDTSPSVSIPGIIDLNRHFPLGDLLSLGATYRDNQEPEALLQDVADAIHHVLGYPRVYVRLRNPNTDELELCAAAGLTDAASQWLHDHPSSPSFYQSLLHVRYRLSESYFLPPGQRAESNGQSLIAAEAGTLIVPLRGHGDRLSGVMYVLPSPDPQALSLSNVRLLEAIARTAALSLDNARLASRTARLLAKEQLLAELARDISHTLDLDTILDRAARRLEVEFQGGTIALLNEQQTLEIVATVGWVDTEARAVRLKLGEGISGWVALHGMPFLSNDTLNETRVPPAARTIGTNKLIRSYISVPLRSGGQVIGTLSVEAKETNAFTYEDVDLLEAVAAQIGGPIASARLYRQTERLAAQLRRRNEQLTVLNTLARNAVSTLDQQRLVQTMCNHIQHGFEYDLVEIYTIDEDNQVYQLVAQTGPLALLGAEWQQPIGSGLLGRAHREGHTVRVDDVALDSDYLGMTQRDIRSELCVPIIAGGRTLALLNVEALRVAAFTDEDVAALEITADVLASGLENARLYRRAQEAAVLEERSRLARDLHDSISQQLFSMTLTAQAARAQLDKNPSRAAGQLERLQETAHAALSEMRALIFQLRPPGLAEQGLIAALQQHVSALGRREGLAISLNVHGEERHARNAEQALYRIVQEALNNIVRHAGAKNVQVDLNLQPTCLTLQIIDDGRGFDLEAVQLVSNGRHLGLTSMRERATELGGSFVIHSRSGEGTEIVVVVPMTSTMANRKDMLDGTN